MVAEHLQVGVLDELAGRSSREQRLTVRLPGVADRDSAANGLEVTTFSVSKKIGAHEITESKLSEAERAGSGVARRWLRCLCTPLPLRRVSSYRNGGPRACSPARLVPRESAGRCGPPSTDPPALKVPRRSSSSSPRREPVCSPAHVPTPDAVQRARDSEHSRWASRRRGKV